MRGGPPYGGRNMGGGQGKNYQILTPFSNTIVLEYNVECRACEILCLKLTHVSNCFHQNVILGYGGNPYGGRGGQDPYPPPPPPSYVRERDNYGNGPPGGYGGGGYNNANSSYNSGQGGYSGGPNSYGGGGSYGGEGNNYGGGGYNNPSGGYGPGPSGYGSTGGGTGGRDNYGSNSGMGRSSIDAYGR